MEWAHPEPVQTTQPFHALRPAHALALAALGLAMLCGQGAHSHGGVYRGPGSTVPPGGAPTSPGVGGPGSAASSPTGDMTSWTTWWSFRRDPYLELRRAIHATGASTPGGAFPLGRGEASQRTVSLRPDAAFLRQRVVPGLIAALEEHRNKDIRTACMVALAKIGDDGRGEVRFADLFLARLGDPNQEVAETAALALGILAEERAAMQLVHLLRSDATGRRLAGEREVPDRTRAFAAYGLGLVGFRSEREDVRRFAVTNLADALVRERFAAHDVPVACLTALGLIPLDARELPVEAGAWSSPSASLGAQVRFLLEVLADRERSPRVRAHVPTALSSLLEGRTAGREGERLKGEVVAALVGLLTPGSREWKEVRQGCVIALGLLGDCDADGVDVLVRETLEREVQRGELLARFLAVIALGEISGRSGTGAEPDVALAGIRKQLLTRLARGTSMSRPWAAFALALGERRRLELGGLPAPAVARALRSGLDQAASPDERGAMCLALGLLRDPEAIPAVQRTFEKLSADLPKGYAAVALGMLRAVEAAPLLRDVVRRSRFRPLLLRESAVALALIGDKQAVPLLIGELAGAGSLSSQAALASALGTIGDARAAEPLLEFLEDGSKTERARAFAAVALGIVGDKEPLPWNSKIARSVNWMAAPATMTDPLAGTGVLDLL